MVGGGVVKNVTTYNPVVSRVAEMNAKEKSFLLFSPRFLDCLNLKRGLQLPRPLMWCISLMRHFCKTGMLIIQVFSMVNN